MGVWLESIAGRGGCFWLGGEGQGLQGDAKSWVVVVVAGLWLWKVVWGMRGYQEIGMFLHIVCQGSH